MKTTKRTILLACLAGMTFMSLSDAATISINNHSFEANVYGSPGGSSSANTGWDEPAGATSGTGRTAVSQYDEPPGIPDGVNYAYTNGTGYLSQTLATTLQINTVYTLTVAVGDRKDLTAPGYGIELWAGTTLIASDYHTDSGNSLPANGTWKDVVASYTSSASDPNAGQSLQIRLRGYGVQTNYDNVRLDGTLVPEPSSALLGGLGLLLMLRRRR